MALIKCKECGKEVSKKAETCPHCGAPVKKKGGSAGCLTIILLGIIVFAIIGSINSYESSVGSRTSSYTPSPTNTASTTRSRDIRYAHSTINVRNGAGKTHEVIGKLKRGQSIEILSREGEWANVLYDGNLKGYGKRPQIDTCYPARA